MLQILTGPSEIQRIAAALRLPAPSAELAAAQAAVATAKTTIDEAGKVNSDGQAAVLAAELTSTNKPSLAELAALKQRAADALLVYQNARAVLDTANASIEPLLARYAADCRAELGAAVDLAVRAIDDRAGEVDELLAALDSLGRDASRQGVKLASKPIAGAAGARRLLSDYFIKMVRAWR